MAKKLTGHENPANSATISAEIVAGWWREAADGKVPDNRACSQLARLIEILPIGEDHTGRKVAEQPVATAIKLLRSKIEPARYHWMKRSADEGQINDLTPGAALARLDALAKALDGLPPDWLGEQTVTAAEPGWHVRARTLYPVAGRSWLDAGNTWGLPCTSDPVCAFVRLALLGIGLHTAPAAVWQFIRNKCRWPHGELDGRTQAR